MSNEPARFDGSCPQSQEVVVDFHAGAPDLAARVVARNYPTFELREIGVAVRGRNGKRNPADKHVLALVIGPLAVHQQVDGIRFVVTHHASGFGISGPLRFDQALRLAVLLAAESWLDLDIAKPSPALGAAVEAAKKKVLAMDGHNW